MADNDDIFGSDDDDFNDVNTKSQAAKKSVFSDDEDDKDIKDLFGDDDDDDVSFTKKSKAYHDEDLNDSDEEDRPRGKKLSKKRKIERPRKKSAHSESGKKKKRSEKSSSNSGDEYDSGEEVRESKEDQEFIDESDDLADLKGEYDEDRQDFSEDKQYKPKKVQKQSSGGSSSQPKDLSSLDPLSRTLIEMKGPKKLELGDGEKEEIAKKLLYQMHAAFKKDLESYQNKQPALLKLKLLETVQHITSMQSVQNTLLELDLLQHFNDWIKPKDANTLPPLALRTAIYKILLNLPVQIDQLKREGNDGPDDKIGKTIVLLRKHKLETPENKRLLKEIMEKWSRIIYEKSTNIDINYQEQSPEILEALRQKYQNSSSQSKEQSEKVALNKMISQNSVVEVEDSKTRARAPVANGFLFAPITQTTLKDLKEKKHQNVIEKALGSDKMKLYKRMIDTKDKSGSHGKKSNSRLVCIYFCCLFLSFYSFIYIS